MTKEIDSIGVPLCTPIFCQAANFRAFFNFFGTKRCINLQRRCLFSNLLEHFKGSFVVQIVAKLSYVMGRRIHAPCRLPDTNK